MRRTIIFALLSIITIGLMANPVGRDMARTKAAKFLCSSKTARVKNLQQMEKNLRPVEAGFSHLHVFNNGENGGFVVVSADDRTEEVLAYSDGGSFEEVPVNGGLYEILAGLNSQVSDAANDFFTARNDTEPQEQDREPVYPLISTSWNQYDPYYDFCPSDPITGQKTLVGCVAITLAQIMKYYEYPKKTTVSIPEYTTDNGIKMPKLSPTTFEYDKMLDYYSPVNSDYYTQEQLNAVHKILKYAGCAVQMQYSSGGSASTFDIARISKYFDYRNDAKLLHAALFPRDTWEEMIYNELAAGRPVPYSAGGVKAQNHSFIIDGYDGRGYFHANTGEFGFFGGLFYCKLHVINDCETQTGPVEFSGYNCYQSAIFNFQPQNSTQTLQTLPAEENMDGKVSKIVVDGVHFYNPYPGERTVAVVNISNQGQTYENYLFLWQGETLKGGVGTYVAPGESGDVVICIAAPEATGNYPVRLTTDWDGNNVVYETTMKIVKHLDSELTTYVEQEGFKGLIWNNPGTDGTDFGYWNWDENWTYEKGIYEKLKVEADFTNTSKNRFNSWISTELMERAPDGELYSYQAKELVNHFYYVDLAPGETKHFTFFYDKHLFKPDKLYYFRIEYNNRKGPVPFTLPDEVYYFPSLPGLKGDANGDGKINISDATAIINYILAKNPQPFNFSNADIDGNSLMNMSDVTRIINVILGK